MWNFRDPYPFPFEERVHLELTDQMPVERRLVGDLLVLQLLRQVDAVVLADIFHRLGRQQSGVGQYPHGVEDMSARRQITAEGSRGDTSQSGQLFLADEAMFVVVVNHKTAILVIP